jgi:hypothetical protein
MNTNEKLDTAKSITCSIGVRLPVQERIEMDAFCAEKDISLSRLVRMAVREFMKKYKDHETII